MTNDTLGKCIVLTVIAGVGSFVVWAQGQKDKGPQHDIADPEPQGTLLETQLTQQER